MEEEGINMEDKGKGEKEGKLIKTKPKSERGEKKEEEGCCASCGKTDPRKKPERKVYANDPAKNATDQNFATNYVRTAKFVDHS